MEWIRSLTLIGLAFVGVVAATLALAAALAPGRAGISDAEANASPGASAAAVQPTPDDGLPRLGGSLTVTGDREGTLVLTHESQEGNYALVGGAGRITFEGAPVVVVQVSYDGLEFFPDESQCAVTPGNLDHDIGVGLAELSCVDISDIRDNGVVTIEGTIGLPVDHLAERELPVTGGSIEVGDETWTFEYALLLLWQQPAIAGQTDANMELNDEARGAALYFHYDIETHRTSVSGVTREGATVDVPANGCSLQREVLGRPNPRSTTIELGIDCPGVDVPGLGPVPIRGSVIVDEIEFPV